MRKIEGDYNNVVGFFLQHLFFKFLDMLIDEDPDFLDFNQLLMAAFAAQMKTKIQN